MQALSSSLTLYEEISVFLKTSEVLDAFDLVQSAFGKRLPL